MNFPERRNHLESMANSENSKSSLAMDFIDSAQATLASDTYSSNIENLDLKPRQAEKRTSCEMDLSPDPFANYPSPRPMYLRYKPNWPQEIFLELEKEAKEGKNPDSDLSSCLSLEVEEEEESHGSDDENEDEEEGGSYSSAWKEPLIKSLFLFIALVLCSSYIYTQKGGTQSLCLRVENFTSQGLSSFDALRSERRDRNQMFFTNMPEIVEAKSDVDGGNEEAETLYNLMTEESEIEHENEILEREQEGIDRASDIMFEIASNPLKSNLKQIVEVKSEVGGRNEEAGTLYNLMTVESEIERENEILGRKQESIDGASDIMFEIANTPFKSNLKQIIERGDMIFRPFVGVLISSLALAPLVIGVCLMHKKNSVSYASSEAKTLQVEPVLEDEIKGVRPCGSVINKLPGHSMEESGTFSYHSRVPVIELLGELEVGEVSISSQRRSGISEGKESICSASLEKPWLYGEQGHSGFLGLSSGNSASNGRLLSDKKSINQQNDWREGHSRKEANTTPLRRSSRIRSRSSVQSP